MEAQIWALILLVSFITGVIGGLTTVYFIVGEWRD